MRLKSLSDESKASSPKNILGYAAFELKQMIRPGASFMCSSYEPMRWSCKSFNFESAAGRNEVSQELLHTTSMVLVSVQSY